MKERKISIWNAILLILLSPFIYFMLYICYAFILKGDPVTSSTVTDYTFIISVYAFYFCNILTILYGFNKYDFSFYLKGKGVEKHNLLIVFLLSIFFFMIDPFLFRLNLFFTDNLPVSVKNESTFFIVHGSVHNVILAPIIEELLFKNIFDKLKRKYSIIFSIFFISLCFTLYHLPALHWYSFLNFFVFSVIGCIIFLKTESIILCIFFHFFGNLFIQISKPYDTFFYKKVYTQYWYVLVLIFASYALVRLLSKLRK